MRRQKACVHFRNRKYQQQGRDRSHRRHSYGRLYAVRDGSWKWNVWLSKPKTILSPLWHKKSTVPRTETGLIPDGDFEANKFRKKPGGDSSFYTIIDTARLLEKHKVDFNILTVLTGYCAENIERIYSYFRFK